MDARELRFVVRGALVAKFLEYRAQISSLEETLDRDVSLVSKIHARFRDEIPRVLEMMLNASYRRIEEAGAKYRVLDSVLEQLRHAIVESYSLEKL